MQSGAFADRLQKLLSQMQARGHRGAWKQNISHSLGSFSATSLGVKNGVACSGT